MGMMILRIALRYSGQGYCGQKCGYFSLNLSANSVMRGRLDARRTLKSLVADLRFYWFVSVLYCRPVMNRLAMSCIRKRRRWLIGRKACKKNCLCWGIVIGLLLQIWHIPCRLIRVSSLYMLLKLLEMLPLLSWTGFVGRSMSLRIYIRIVSSWP